jgi:biopolymer transport protein ExbB
MLLFLLDGLEAIRGFFNLGGPVLILIAGLTFFMWLLLLERASYFLISYKHDAQAALDYWEARGERRSWHALAIRDKLISELHVKIEHNLAMIKTMIAICPLFGLLGTVTGMIEVFTVLSIGGGEARSMADGISRATIPTMAGMVAALSGVFANITISQRAARERELIEEHLTSDH